MRRQTRRRRSAKVHLQTEALRDNEYLAIEYLVHELSQYKPGEKVQPGLQVLLDRLKMPADLVRYMVDVKDLCESSTDHQQAIRDSLGRFLGVRIDAEETFSSEKHKETWEQVDELVEKYGLSELAVPKDDIDRENLIEALHSVRKYLPKDITTARLEQAAEFFSEKAEDTHKQLLLSWLLDPSLAPPPDANEKRTAVDIQRDYAHEEIWPRIRSALEMEKIFPIRAPQNEEEREKLLQGLDKARETLFAFGITASELELARKWDRPKVGRWNAQLPGELDATRLIDLLLDPSVFAPESPAANALTGARSLSLVKTTISELGMAKPKDVLKRLERYRRFDANQMSREAPIDRVLEKLYDGKSEKSKVARLREKRLGNRRRPDRIAAGQRRREPGGRHPGKAEAKDRRCGQEEAKRCDHEGAGGGTRKDGQGCQSSGGPAERRRRGPSHGRAHCSQGGAIRSPPDRARAGGP